MSDTNDSTFCAVYVSSYDLDFLQDFRATFSAHLRRELHLKYRSSIHYPSDGWNNPEDAPMELTFLLSISTDRSTEIPSLLSRLRREIDDLSREKASIAKFDIETAHPLHLPELPCNP